MATPSSINLNDLRPAAPAGRLNVHWLASEPRLDPDHPARLVRDVSASVVSATGGVPIVIVVELAITAANAGNFTVAHHQGLAPTLALIEMSSAGAIWFQPSRHDATNLYLVASDAGVTARVSLWFSVADAELALAPAAPGNFSVAHGLGVTPALVLIQMTSGGAIWFQSTEADATNVNVVASDAGLTGYAIAWKNLPVPFVIKHAEVELAPAAPGNFAVAHGLGVLPRLVVIKMTSAGAIQEQTAADATNLNLSASEAGITGKAEIWA